jgi:hypothetical protein
MTFITDDLKYAQAAGVCAEVRLLTGETLLTGVHEVNEGSGFVSLHAPMTFEDNTTTRKVGLDLIASVSVTDVEWN